MRCHCFQSSARTELTATISNDRHYFQIIIMDEGENLLVYSSSVKHCWRPAESRRCLSQALVTGWVQVVPKWRSCWNVFLFAGALSLVQHVHLPCYVYCVQHQLHISEDSAINCTVTAMHACGCWDIGQWYMKGRVFLPDSLWLYFLFHCRAGN